MNDDRERTTGGQATRVLAKGLDALRRRFIPDA
jgi:hypothetical protein